MRNTRSNVLSEGPSSERNMTKLDEGPSLERNMTKLDEGP